MGCIPSTPRTNAAEDFITAGFENLAAEAFPLVATNGGGSNANVIVAKASSKAKEYAEKAESDPDARVHLMRALQDLSKNSVALRRETESRTKKQRLETLDNLVTTSCLVLSPKTVYLATASANAALAECLSAYDLLAKPNNLDKFQLSGAEIQSLVENLDVAVQKIKDAKAYRNTALGELEYVLNVLRSSIQAFPRSDANAELANGVTMLGKGIIKSILTFQPNRELIQGAWKTGVAVYHKWDQKKKRDVVQVHEMFCCV